MDLSPLKNLFVRHRTAVWCKTRTPNLRYYVKNSPRTF